jgi:hypothetical protein
MGFTRYDLRVPTDVERYLDRVNGEHNAAFETWRQRRIATGHPILAVEHPEGVQTPPSEAGFPEVGRGF